MYKVLGLFAFSRAPKRTVKLILGLMAFAAVGLIGSSTFAAPGSPIIARAQTQDLNGDGHLDAVLVTFSVPMDGSSVPGGFSVDGYSLGNPSAQWVPAQNGVHPTQLRLNLVPKTTGDTDARPTVKYRTPASPPAQSAPPLNVPLEAADKVSEDTAGPVLQRAVAADVAPSNIFNKGGDELQLHFSEPVKIIGQNSGDRAQSLELAFKFSRLDGGVCIGDGQDADPDNAGDTNFPSPKTANDPAGDPVAQPAPGAANRIVRAVFSSEAAQNPSVIHTPAIPGQCGVGIDANGVANIVDTAGPVPNNAVSQDFGGVNRHRRAIEIAPRGIRSLATQDLLPASGGDGMIDAIRLSYEYPILDSSVTDALAPKYTVKVGAATATVAAVETGVPGDEHLLIRLTGVNWGGGERPRVSYDSAGCLLKVGVPTPANYACADAFANVQTIDGVGPAVLGSGTVDSDLDGLVDGVEVGVTEAVASGATPAGWKVNGEPAASLSGAGTATITLGIVESFGSAATPQVEYDATAGDTTDTAGAELRSQVFTAADKAAPRLLKATTLATAANGKTDRVTFEFSEPVLSSGLTASSFSIEGTPASAFGTSSLDATSAPNDALITVVVDKAGTGRFGVGFTAPLTDGAGNLNVDGGSLPSTGTVDGVAPVVTLLSTSPVSPFGIGTVTVNAGFSEVLDTAVVPTAAIGSRSVTPVADASHTNGFVNDNASGWDGTVDFAAADCAEQNGCTLALTLAGAKDPSGNTGIAANPVSVTVDTVAPDAATGEAAAAIQETGAPAIDANKIGGRTKNLKVTANFTAGQVNTTGSTAGGIAEVLIDGASLNPPARQTGIGAAASSLTINTAFANNAALRTAIPEGQHTVSIRLTDAAGNAVTSAGVPVVADYSPVVVGLIAPQGAAEPYTGGDHICVQWDGDEADTTLKGVDLRYSIDGGTSYSRLIAAGVGIDAIGDCAGVGNAYDWTLPGMNTNGLRVQIGTIDEFGNEAKSASATNMTVATITQTVTSIAAQPSGLVYGASTTISGVVSGNGFPIAGKTVAIQRRTFGQTAFTTIGTATTNGEGRYAYSFKPAAGADYKAVFARSGPYLASESVLKRVTVAVSVPSRVNATSLRRGQTFQISGSVLPAHPGKKVWLQAYLAGKWTTLSQQILGTSNSYSFTYRSTTARTLLFRVAFPTQDGEHAWNISTRYMVTWR